MKFRLKPVEIDPENPFISDKLDRRSLVENLTTLIKNGEAPFVVSVEASFGLGKTTFLKMLDGYLSKHGTPTVFYDAWGADFSENPLLSLFSSLDGMLKGLDPDSKLKGAISNVKNASIKLFKEAAPALGKIVVLKLSGKEVDHVDEVLADYTEKAAIEKLRKVEADGRVIQEFKTALAELVRKLNEKRGSSEPLVIIIDELDRCRPPFAVGTLEAIKHMFDVEGVIFVLGVNKSQIGQSIKKLYGEQNSSEDYLKKFVDVEFTLPEPNREMFIKHLTEEMDFASLFSGRGEPDRSGRNQLESNLIALSKIFELSLREIWRCLSRLSVVFSLVKQNEQLYVLPTVIFVVLHEKRIDLYNSNRTAKTRNATLLIKELNELGAMEDLFIDDYGEVNEALLHAAITQPDSLNTVIQEYLNKEKQLKGHESGRRALVQ